MVRREVTKMDKAPKGKKAQVLTRLLKRINSGADPRLLKRDAHNLLPSVNPRDIATAEQNLIDDGFSARVVQQLSAAFVLMGILEDKKTSIKNNLSSHHILRKIIAEHDLLRCFISDLEDLTETIQQMETLTDASCEFRRLCHIIEHLDAMDEHFEEEEDVIFPFLKKYGWTSLCRSARSDHVYIRIAIGDLVRLIGTFESKKLKEFKIRLNSATSYLCPALTEHMFQEDNILYPIALEVISDNRIWEKMKALCDEIGYCGVHV